MLIKMNLKNKKEERTNALEAYNSIKNFNSRNAEEVK